MIYLAIFFLLVLSICLGDSCPINSLRMQLLLIVEFTHTSKNVISLWQDSSKEARIEPWNHPKLHQKHIFGRTANIPQELGPKISTSHGINGTPSPLESFESCEGEFSEGIFVTLVVLSQIGLFVCSSIAAKSRILV